MMPAVVCACLRRRATALPSPRPISSTADPASSLGGGNGVRRTSGSPIFSDTTNSWCGLAPWLENWLNRVGSMRFGTRSCANIPSGPILPLVEAAGSPISSARNEDLKRCAGVAQ